MAEQGSSAFGRSWQPNEDNQLIHMQSDDTPVSASGTITRQQHSKHINANGLGRKYSGKISRLDKLAEEIKRLSKEKQNVVMKDKEPNRWKNEIKQRMEYELDQQVKKALETPPLERMQRNSHKARMRKIQHEETPQRPVSHEKCNTHTQTLPKVHNGQSWNKTECHQLQHYEQSSDPSDPGIGFHDGVSMSGGTNCGHNKTPGAWGDGRRPDLTTEIRRTFHGEKQTEVKDASEDECNRQCQISEIRRKAFHRYTASGFKEALKQGKLKLKKLGNGRYMDKNGVILTSDGPFWPPECGPLYGKPEHIYDSKHVQEPLSDAVPHDGRSIHTQRTKWYRPWERSQVVFDSERTSKGTVPHTVPDGCCPSLVFESRFESGNLRQAKRIGQFEYDLVVKTDLYTNRHTQWYYFLVKRMVPGVTYKFNIINLLKKDSLYNHGMRPLMYSEKVAEASNIGWMRTGHHISYNRSYGYTRNSLLHPEMIYYVLEWQTEFRYKHDTCYLAHCYPYTFTDLKKHLDILLSEPERRRCLKREVMCETKAGNSCFLLTVSDFSEKTRDGKKAIVVTARVHPGETNSSWMMKGLLDFITSSDPIAMKLRELFIFKIIPMLNPDGVIVGNYRCSLSARDLNRNYRHPNKESFPTIWHMKNILEKLVDNVEVVVYCDLHGHSRKHNVFIYGCDPQSKEGDAASFLYQRLFPWLMSQKAPDKFSFRGCKFRVKRCKESTGRVVMWRQMNVANSFTMEATFCGAKNMESVDIPHHFNTSDFQDLGRHFCEALLEYHKAQQNKSLHSELILELTREITHQVLQSRGLLPVNMPANYIAVDRAPGKHDPMATDTQSQPGTKNSRKKSDSMHAGKDKSLSDEVGKIQSRLKALKMIDALSSETIKGCIHILQELHITREFVESDSSDSDSAAESEQLKEEPEEDCKQRPRKKKNRLKNKSHDVILPELRGQDGDELSSKKQDSNQYMKLSLLVHEDSQSTGTQAHTQLPIALQFHNPISHLNPDLRCFRKAFHTKSQRVIDELALQAEDIPTMYQLLEPQAVSSDISQSDDTTSSSRKCTHLKKYPPFVNRFIKRGNGGIPMFSQERIEERSLKRLHTVHKIQQEKQDSTNQYTDSEEYSRLLSMTRKIQEQEADMYYTMSSSPPAPLPMTCKQPYTHSNSFYGLHHTSPSAHYLEPMEPVNIENSRDGLHVQKLVRSKTMIHSLHQTGLPDQSADSIGHDYYDRDLVSSTFDKNNNSFKSSNAIHTNEFSGTRAMHQEDGSRTIPHGLGKRTLSHLNMKRNSSDNPNSKYLLGRTSPSAATSNNPNKSKFKASAAKHRTAPVGHQDNQLNKTAAVGHGTPSVNRGHAVDLTSQQYRHFLLQMSKAPPSAAARYLESLTKSFPNKSPRPVLNSNKTNDDNDSLEIKRLTDLKL